MKKNLLLISVVAFMAISCANGRTENAGLADYTPTKSIDLEHHFYDRDFVDFLKTRTECPYYRVGEGVQFFETMNLPLDAGCAISGCPGQEQISMVDVMCDLGEDRVAALDYAGVTTACLSTSDGIESGLLSCEDAVKYARMTNDAVARAVKEYPGRFIGTICLPMPYVEESLAELDRAVNELGLSYWHTHSNYGKHYLYESQFEPILARCAELGIPFYLHPGYSEDPFLSDFVLATTSYAFTVEVMKVALKLVLNGTFDRYPNLRMILGHMGEFFPYCLDRLNNRAAALHTLANTTVSNEDFTYYFKNKNIFMTTSGIYDPKVVMFVIDEIGVDNILLGSDYPYENFKASVDFVKCLPISNEDKDKILYKNAEKYILKSHIF